MASYITITDAETDPEAPLTSELAKKWRDNPLANFEKDTSVPNNLRVGKWLLGTFATTTGSSVVASGLDLTEYVSLEVIISNVSTNNTASELYLVQTDNIQLTGTLTTASNRWGGVYVFDLTTGAFAGVSGTQTQIGRSPVNIGSTGGMSSITNATTSITFSLDTGTFDAGSITLYGVR